MFGSVPLRTYLPDGDIDISVFARSQDPEDQLKDTWGTQLLKALEKEGGRHDAPFRIRNCQIIQAEVKLVKFVVADVVVDVSFNALGGLCTVAFLEWADRTIGKDHLFKRSIVLVKAWCYYESRLLGAHHGLISSYALETMVLHVFNLYGKELTSPLDLLRCFLQVFSKFDWDKYALTILGPLPLTFLDAPNHEIPAEDQQLCAHPLLEYDALRNAVNQYSVKPEGAVEALDLLHVSITKRGSTLQLSTNGVTFPRKFLNILDPLLPSNNLGRSVNGASFSRIKRALKLGWQVLEEITQMHPLAASESISAYFKNTLRSPLRMAADNQVFQNMLTVSGAKVGYAQNGRLDANANAGRQDPGHPSGARTPNSGCGSRVITPAMSPRDHAAIPAFEEEGAEEEVEQPGGLEHAVHQHAPGHSYHDLHSINTANGRRGAYHASLPSSPILPSTGMVNLHHPFYPGTIVHGIAGSAAVPQPVPLITSTLQRLNASIGPDRYSSDLDLILKNLDLARRCQSSSQNVDQNQQLAPPQKSEELLRQSTESYPVNGSNGRSAGSVDKIVDEGETASGAVQGEVLPNKPGSTSKYDSTDQKVAEKHKQPMYSPGSYASVLMVQRQEGESLVPDSGVQVGERCVEAKASVDDSERQPNSPFPRLPWGRGYTNTRQHKSVGTPNVAPGSLITAMNGPSSPPSKSELSSTSPVPASGSTTAFATHQGHAPYSIKVGIEAKDKSSQSFHRPLKKGGAWNAGPLPSAVKSGTSGTSTPGSAHGSSPSRASNKMEILTLSPKVANSNKSGKKSVGSPRQGSAKQTKQTTAFSLHDEEFPSLG